MSTRLNRHELDRIAEACTLDDTGVEQMLETAGARPTRAESRDFLARCARYGGLLSLAAGVVFFVAANWSRLAVFGRFALLELVLVGLVAVALYKPPPRILGRSAAFLAFIVTGALLALFGQTYQTGADVYELFLTWTLLGLPFVVAAQWGLASAAWVLVLDTALMLFCGWHPRGGLLWLVFDGTRFTTTHAILAAAYLNLVLWFVFEKLELPAVPEWTRRIALACGFAFVTWAGVLGVAGGDLLWNERPALGTAIAGAFAAIGLVSWFALHRRRDVFPLAMALASFIVIGMVWIAEVVESADEATFFLMALWLIGTSTLGGRLLVGLMRRWRAEPA
jgi:uncharacterized membrane protein